MGTEKPAPDFAGVRNASTTSAWAFRSPRYADTPLSPFPQKFSNSPSSILTTSPNGKELSGGALDAASSDPVAFIEGIQILRVYVSLDEMPFALLDVIYTHLQSSGNLEEVHICIQSLLRSALQKVHDNFGLERALTSTIRKWAAGSTALKFFFLLPGVATSSPCVTFDSYQEVDLLTAIRESTRGSVELGLNARFPFTKLHAMVLHLTMVIVQT
jgi:hypothetical protein